MKKDNTLKRLGMQSEFKRWIKDINERDFPLEVGERIELVKEIELMKELKLGMKGTIENIEDGDISINFDNFGTRNLFNIRERYRRIK